MFDLMAVGKILCVWALQIKLKQKKKNENIETHFDKSVKINK